MYIYMHIYITNIPLPTDTYLHSYILSLHYVSSTIKHQSKIILPMVFTLLLIYIYVYMYIN